MDHPFLVLVAITALALLYVWTPVVLGTFQRYRKQRQLICPETGKPATIHIDAKAAAIASAVGRFNVKVTACTLWPGKAGCAQGCLFAPYKT